MPRYGITTFLNKKEHDKVQETAEKLGTSKYKLLRESVLTYCEACNDCLKEEKQDVRTSEGSNKAPEDDSRTNETSEDIL